MTQILNLQLDDFTDSSPSGHIVTPSSDGRIATLSASPPTIDTSVYKFTASGKFVRANSQSLYFDDSLSWYLGNVWTLRFWINFISHTADYVPIGQVYNVNNRWIVYFNCAGNYVAFFAIAGGTIKAYYTATFTPTNGVWYHFFFGRDGSNFYMYKDGADMSPTAVNAVDSNDFTDLAAPLEIGRQGDGLVGQYCNCYLDDLELAKDVLRSFTVPVSAIIPDKYTELYLPFDANFNSVLLPVIDTDIKYSGTGSGRFKSADKQFLIIADSDDFNINIDSYRFLGYLYLNSHPVIDANLAYFFHILGQTVDINNRWGIVYQENSAHTTSYIVIYSVDGGTLRFNINGNVSVFSLNTWYKFEVKRWGDLIAIYVDDVLLSVTNVVGKGVANFGASLQVAKDALTSYPHYFDGHIDGLEMYRWVDGNWMGINF